MNIKNWILLLLTLPLFIGSSSTKVNFFRGSLTNAKNKAANEEKLYFIDFTASWCMPCQWMDETTFSDPRVSSYIQQNYVPVKIDIDDFDGYAIKELHNIKLLPSILIFNAKGEQVARYEESLSPSKLLKILEEHNTPENRIGGPGSALPPSFSQSEATQPTKEISRAPLNTTKTKPSGINKRKKLPKVEASPKEIAPEITAKETPQTPSYSNSRTNTTLPAVSSPDLGLFRFEVSRQASQGFSIQVGTYASYGNVLREAVKLEDEYKQPIIVQIANIKGKTAYRVMVGEFDSSESAAQLLGKMKQNKLSGFVKDLSLAK